MEKNILRQKLPIILALLFTFNMTFAQEIEPQDKNSQQENYNYYIGQHQKLKKTGYILLGAGAGLMLGGVVFAASGDSWSDVGAGALIFTFGGLSTVASIPVFIVSGSKKRKAKTYLEGGVGSMANLSLNNPKYAAISLKLDF